MSGWAEVATQMRVAREQAEELLERVDRATPEQANTIFRSIFEEQIAQMGEGITVMRATAEAMQRVRDAMSAKLGRVQA